MTGFDVLVDGCDGEDTTINGFSFDCGTGFCTTGPVVESSLSFTDISCNNNYHPHTFTTTSSYSIIHIFSLDSRKLRDK